MIMVCMAPIRILCCDPSNEQKTFKPRKVNIQGHGSADHDLNMRVI